MTIRTTTLTGLLILATIAGAAAQSTTAPAPDGRDADRAAIRAHIESIFQAFIDGDVDKIYATHAADWRGFLEGSRTPIKGIDEYMRANGIPWPRPTAPAPAAPANAGASTPAPRPATAAPGYAVKDFDVQFYGPDLAVACFVGEFNRTSNGATVTTNRLHIMDVYGRRDGHWIQVASHTVVDPVFLADRNATALPAAAIPPQMRQQILDAREAVWRAYFAGNRAGLETLLPAETIAINEAADDWANRDAILAGATRLAATGAKLVALEFPKTELQIFGNVVIVYSSYRYELDTNGRHTVTTGRATEMFVRRNGTLLNVGWHLDAGK